MLFENPNKINVKPHLRYSYNNFNINNYVVVSGTGHRPDKLGGHNKWPLVEPRLIALACCHISKLRESHPNLAIMSGMALGWDTVLSKAARELDIPLLAATPCFNQGSRWSAAQNETHRELLLYASEIIVVHKDYSAKAMQDRNIFMVNECYTMLNCWDGTTGGTYNCVKYINKMQRNNRNLWKDIKCLINAS